MDLDDRSCQSEHVWHSDDIVVHQSSIYQPYKAIAHLHYLRGSKLSLQVNGTESARMKTGKGRRQKGGKGALTQKGLLMEAEFFDRSTCVRASATPPHHTLELAQSGSSGTLREGHHNTAGTHQQKC